MKKLIFSIFLIISSIGSQASEFELESLILRSQKPAQGSWQCHESYKSMTINNLDKTFVYTDDSGGCFGPFITYEGYYVEYYTYNKELKVSFIANKSSVFIFNSAPRKIFEVNIDIENNNLQVFGVDSIYSLYDFKTLVESNTNIKIKKYKFDQVDFTVIPKDRR